MTAARVLVTQRILTHYRVTFFDRLREALGQRGIDLHLIYGQPNRWEQARADTGELEWGEKVHNLYLRVGSKHLVWQPYIHAAQTSDLVIVEQASRLLTNYLILGLRQFRGKPLVALWGHGRNLQGHSASGVGEFLKRCFSRRADLWFAYTAMSKQILMRFGYPEDSIVVTNNAYDTEELRMQISSISPEERSEIRAELGLGEGPTALFIGGLYQDKRIPFLIESCILVAKRIPQFGLIVAGGGPLAAAVTDAAETYPWLRFVGPKFGIEKAKLLAIADVFLMPGLVGLALLDSFAARVPMVTTAVEYHSPEIDYLSHDDNGLMVRPADSAEEYAAAIVELMTNSDLRLHLRAGCEQAANQFTLSKMVDAFIKGIELGLSK